MYRPTVRMDDRFRDWLDDVTQVTTLDRNQIIRLSLFLAGNSKKFKIILENFLKSPSKPLPSPKWDTVEHGLWQNQTFSGEVGETSGENDVTFEIIDARGENVDRKIVVRANETGIIKWSL